jgi:MFS transporter, ACS family, hexuronate transporter
MMTSPIETPAKSEPQAALRAWGICGLMLLATMLNYMDRQALAQQATRISTDLKLSNEDYARLESGFGLAFAVGGIVSGWLADRVSPRWLYPAVLLGWSAVGYATGGVKSYAELYICRILLGFFESGQWPCALVSAQRLLSRRDRPLGNSILQSGASMGAIITPIVVTLLAFDGPGGWRLPFRVIGASGVFWVVAWLATVRGRDLELATSERLPAIDDESLGRATLAASTADARPARELFLSRFLALAVTVITINLCWQFFRAWMPKMLREQYAYTEIQVQSFSVAYYVAADAGCIAIGLLVKWLAGRRFSVHGARMTTFCACSFLTALSAVAAMLPASWWLLLILLLIGFASLGQFPNYYAFTQELSTKKMGKVTGALSFIFWLSYGMVSDPVGAWIDRTGSFSQVMLWAGLLPLVGFGAILLLWDGPPWRARAVLSGQNDAG